MVEPPRILIVEDEVLIAMCLEMELKQAGYEVCRRVAKGEDALHLVKQELFDCILMDIQLAGDMDGIETAQQIQAHTDVPVIFMTGFPDKLVEERAQTLKPLGYFLKPVQVTTLDPLIKSAQVNP